MDPVSAHGRPLPPPFLTRDFHLHQFQHHQQQNSEDEQSGNGDLNRGQKREHDEITNNNNTLEGLELVPSSSGGEGELSRRPRGRPAGLRTSLKPPIIITRDSANALRSMSWKSLAVAISWRVYQLLQGGGKEGFVLATPAPPAASGLTVYLAGGQGQVVGGSVAGPLLASGPVVVMAASFGNAAYERLPLEEDIESQTPMLGGGPLGSPGINNIGQQQQNQQQQQLMQDPKTSLFQGLPQNLLNSVQLPAEAYWGTGGRPPY
ncbi:hypothetical protein NC651_031705 [Populus alba x Populus x berolinensis]|nr:hypothetical protein NC651_031705 [Populus alba x Populus x berolinensis]